MQSFQEPLLSPQFTSPVRNDRAIEADLRRRQLHPREAGIFRNALKLCESVSVAGGRSGQHHHAEGGRGGRCNAIRIGNEFSNCGAATWLDFSQDMA